MMYYAVFVISFFGTKFVGLERTVLGLKKMGTYLQPLLNRGANIDDIGNRLERTLHRVPLAIKCLDQAIAAWFWLNVNGHNAILRIGVSITPLESHAWVECEGRTFVRATNIPDLKIVAEYGGWRNLGI